MQDEIATARLEIDTVKNQKKCFEGIEIVEGENDYPQEAIKLNKETLTKAIFQHTGQLNVPVAENTMLNPELENAKANKDWKQKWNPTVLDWLLPHMIMIKVRHQKETWNLPPRKQKIRGYACRTK